MANMSWEEAIKKAFEATDKETLSVSEIKNIISNNGYREITGKTPDGNYWDKNIYVNKRKSSEDCIEAGIKVVQQELGQRDREIDLHKFEDEKSVEDRLRLVAEVALRDIVGRDESGNQVLLDVERSIQYQKPFAQEGRGIHWAVIERVTTTQNHVAAAFGYRPTSEELATVKAKIERVAAEIASGCFPEIPGMFCQFSRKLPSVSSFQKTLTPEAPKKPRGSKGKAAQSEEIETEVAA